MTISEIKTMAANKLAALRTQRANAVNAGDIEMTNEMDIQIAETEITLNQLNSI